MNESAFKKTTINEMCKQVVSAPVIFRKKDGTEGLAFYNNEDSIQATKLYILFPGNIMPKYIEGNDLYVMRECIIHGIYRNKALELYGKVNGSHKRETAEFFATLIDKAPAPMKVSPSVHAPANRGTIRHACGCVTYKGTTVITVMKDLDSNNVAEIWLNHEIQYNVLLDKVHWAVKIPAKDFTQFKMRMRKLYSKQ